MPDALATPPATECARDELPIFICTLKNGKLLNVCATTDPASPAKAAFAQYRVGKRGTPADIAIPARSGGDLPTFASVPYSGGGEAQMSFANAGVRYIVFSRVIRTNFAAGEPNNPAFEDGVIVLDGEKPVRTLACEGEARKPLDYNLAAQYGTKAGDVFYPE